MELVEAKTSGERQNVKTEDKSSVCIEIENSKPVENNNNADEATRSVEIEYVDKEREAYLDGPKTERRKHARSVDNLKATADSQPPYPPPNQQQQYPPQHTYPPYPGYPGYPGYPPTQYQQQPPGMYGQAQWGQGQQQQHWSPYGQGQGYPGYPYQGYEEQEREILRYDPQTRNKYVALVMGLVFLMLLFTAVFLAISLSIPEVKQFFRLAGFSLIFLSMMGLLIVNYAMICLPAARRPPCNFFMLLLAAFFMSVFAAKISSYFRTEVILYAVVATGAAVFVCVLLAFSKFDFTSWMLYVVMISAAFSVIVMIILLTMLFTGTIMKPLIIVILIIGTLIQCVMLTMQLQMILGGRTIQISESDYAIAALMVYSSIIDIFLKILMIFGLLGGEH